MENVIKFNMFLRKNIVEIFDFCSKAYRAKKKKQMLNRVNKTLLLLTRVSLICKDGFSNLTLICKQSPKDPF